MRSERDALLSLQRFVAGVLPEPWDVRTVVEAGPAPDRPYALVEYVASAETSGAPAVQQLAVAFTVNLFLPAAPTRKVALDTAMALRETMWQAVKWGPDARRPTTDRLPLFCYDPRVEVHRFKVAGASGGTFTIGLADDPDDVDHVVQTAALEPTAIAADVAAAIAAALLADDAITDAADVVGYDRGSGLWDIHYTGALAGTRPAVPSVDGSGLAAALLGLAPVASATVALQGAPAPWRAPSDYMNVDDFSQNTVPDPDDPTLVMVAVNLRLTFARGLPLPLERRILQRISATAGSATEA